MMGGLWMNIAKLMRYNRPAPYTFCTPTTPCFLCAWRQECSGYNKGRKRNLITLNDALEEAKGYLAEEDKLPSFPTVYRWAKNGVISEPVGRENKGKAGGMKDLYPLTLPLEIAVTCHLLAIKVSLKRIAEVRQAFMNAKNDGVRLHELISDLDSEDKALREYVYYYFSLPYQKKSPASYKVLVGPDGKVRVSESDKRLLSAIVPLSGKLQATSNVRASLTIIRGGQDKT